MLIAFIHARRLRFLVLQTRKHSLFRPYSSRTEPRLDLTLSHATSERQSPHSRYISELLAYSLPRYQKVEYFVVLTPFSSRLLFAPGPICSVFYSIHNLSVHSLLSSLSFSPLLPLPSFLYFRFVQFHDSSLP